MTVYLIMGSEIVTSRRVGYGARCVERARRVPRPVRTLLRECPGREVSYNPKTRAARLVPILEQHHGW